MKNFLAITKAYTVAYTVACTALLSAAVILLPGSYAEAQRRPACTMEKLAKSRAISAERKAIQKLGKAERTLTSLEGRLDRDELNLENNNQRCEIQIINKEEQLRNILNRYEDQRRRYLTDAQALIAQAALCNIGGLLDPDSRSCDRDQLLRRANDLARKASLIEARISSVRDNNNRNMANLRAKCASKAAQLQTIIDRSRGRVVEAQAAIPALQADAQAKTAARVAAEDALVRCQG